MPRSVARPDALRRTVTLATVASLLLLAVGVVPARAATLARFATTNAVYSGSWANPQNAYADDGVYATTTLTWGEQSTREYGGFGFDSIPASATITSVSLEIEFKVSRDDLGDAVRVQAALGGFPTGSAGVNASQPTTDTVLATSSTGITTRDQLLDGTFSVLVTNQRPADGINVLSTLLLDYVKVTVVYTVPDTTPPVVTVPADIIRAATSPAGAVVTYIASATDDVDGPLAPACSPASGSTFPVGITTVTCTATDAAGNTGSAAFGVTVTPYVNAPPVLDPIGDQAIAEGARKTVTITASDVDGDTLSFVAGPALPSFATFVDNGNGTATLTLAPGFADAGSYPITIGVSDRINPPDSEAITIRVTNTDLVAPVVTVPANMTMEATSAAGAAVSFTATATDDVDGPLTPVCSPASGSTFALGATTVTCTATDAARNTASRSFTVTVVDTTPPAITTPDGGTPPDLTVEATSPTGAGVSFVLGATDGVDGTLTPTCSPASGSLFPVGATTVSCSVTDRAGNVAGLAFEVTVTPYEGPIPTTPPTSTEDPAGVGSVGGGSVLLVLWLAGLAGALGLLTLGLRRRAQGSGAGRQ